MYSYEGYNQPKYCKGCMQENLAFQCHGHQSKSVIWTKYIWLVEDYSRNISVKLLPNICSNTETSSPKGNDRSPESNVPMSNLI